MGEYFEWRQDDGPMVVRVHRRVIAGIERERAPEVAGVLLGTTSPAAHEVVVEDFAPLQPGVEFDPSTGAIAGQKRPSLAPVGYFRAGGADLVEPADRDHFDRLFPDPDRVLLIFQRSGPKIEWSDVYVQPGVAAPPPSAPDRTASHSVDEPAPPRTWRRFVWPAVAVIAGVLLIVGAAYVSADRDARRHDREMASQRAARPPLADWKPAPPPPAQEPARAVAPVAPQAAPSDADRSAGLASAAPASNAEIKQQVRKVLSDWRDALLSNNLDAFVDLYAPSVGPYFRENRVSRAQIADEVQRMIGRYGPLTSYKLKDVTIAPVDENHAIANFRKEWRTARNTFSGAEKAQLRFERQNGRWQIVSEQELRVYWARKR